MISRITFVACAVWRVARRCPGTEQDLMDLIQEGNLALLQVDHEWLDRPPRSAHQALIARRAYQALRERADSSWRESARSCALEGHWEELSPVEAPGGLELLDRLIYREGQGAVVAIQGCLDQRPKKVVALGCGLFDGRELPFWQEKEPH